MKINIPFLNDFKIILTESKSQTQSVASTSLIQSNESTSASLIQSNKCLWILICNPYNNLLKDFKDMYLHVADIMNSTQPVGMLGDYFKDTKIDYSKTIVMMDTLHKADLIPNILIPLGVITDCLEFSTAFKKIQNLTFNQVLHKKEELSHGKICHLSSLRKDDASKIKQGGFVVVMFEPCELSEDRVCCLEYLSQHFHETMIHRSSIINIYLDHAFIIFKHKMGDTKEPRDIRKGLLACSSFMMNKRTVYDNLFNQFKNLRYNEMVALTKRYNKRNIAFSIRLANKYNITVNSRYTSKYNAMIYNIYNVNKYFSTNKDTQSDKLLLTKEAVYSMSKPESAEKITEIIIRSLKKNNSYHPKLTITDATANIGGNTLNFSKHFHQVISIEPDEYNFRALRANVVDAFGCKNVRLIKSTYNDTYKTLRQDLVFVDPPWGGLYYNYLEKQMLYLGSMDMLELFVESRAQCVVYKLPTNFDYCKLISKMSSLRCMGSIELHTVNSFIIMIIYKNTEST